MFYLARASGCYVKGRGGGGGPVRPLVVMETDGRRQTKFSAKHTNRYTSSFLLQDFPFLMMLPLLQQLYTYIQEKCHLGAARNVAGWL